MPRNRSTVVRTADDAPISETVLFAVAAARDLCPTELETPLYDVIDPDALDDLFSLGGGRPDPQGVSIEFSWAGCDVVVDGTGRVEATAQFTTERGFRVPA